MKYYAKDRKLIPGFLMKKYNRVIGKATIEKQLHSLFRISLNEKQTNISYAKLE